MKFTLGLLIVLVLSEGAARIAESGGPPVLRWYDATTQLKIEQMDELEAEVVFVGSSMVWQGMVPGEFQAADDSGRSAYNAGLAGGVPVVMEPWILDHVVPRLHPDTVVWGFSSLDFAPAYGTANLSRFEDALNGRNGWLSDIERTVSRVSALVRYRSVLRDPGELAGTAGTHQRQAFDLAAANLGPRGERLDFRIEFGDTRRSQVESRLTGYALDRDDIASALQVITALQAAGVEVVLVEMPHHQTMTEMHPNGALDVQLSHAAIVAIADETGTQFVDLSKGFSPSDFVDFTHLSQAGAARLTQRLATTLNPDRGSEKSAATALASAALAINDSVHQSFRGGGSQGGNSELWWSTAHYGHTRDLETLSSVDLMFIGDSRMQAAGDPAIIEDSLGLTSYNAALPSAGPEVTAEWLPELFDQVTPGLVIYGITPNRLRLTFDLEGACTADISRWHEAADLRRNAFGSIPGLQELRFADLAFGDLTLESPIQRGYDTNFGPDGFRSVFQADDTPEEIADWRDSLIEPGSRDIRLCSERIDLFAGVIENLTDHGVTVITVLLPGRPEDWAQWTPNSFNAALDRISTRATAAGSVAVMDLSNSVPGEHFRDGWHLNREGSTVFTNALVDRLIELGF